MSAGAVSERVGVAHIRAGARVRAGTLVGIGDDAAVLDLGRPAVACVDVLVDGVHFRRGVAPPRDIGHKALAVNLSDLAAMGAVPRAALVGLTLPADGMPAGELDELYAGMERLAARHGVTLAGGDTTAGPVLSLAVTALGEMEPGVAPLRRAAGLPGDVLCVTGPLGAAAAGLLLAEGRAPRAATARAGALLDALHRPEPRVAEGRALAAGGARAGLDLSDGLVIDAGRLAAESGCAARVALERVPRAAGVDELARAVGAAPDVLAATGGDDYELLVAVPPARVAALSAVLPRPLAPVGTLVAGEGVEATRDGAPVTLKRAGWELP